MIAMRRFLHAFALAASASVAAASSKDAADPGASGRREILQGKGLHVGRRPVMPVRFLR